VVQDLSYTYDPTGNITHIQDNADIQNVVFFRNKRVEPSNDYTYDAIYRLINASGREHLGQNGAGQPLPPTPTSYNDFPHVGLLQPGDGKAMGTYSEQYQYDAVGNFLQFIHRGTDPANPVWTRAYTYNEASLLEPGQTSNRLTRTMVNPGGAQPQNENYTHDLHGNITRMPQLQVMQWDFKDQLSVTQRQAVNADDTDGVQHQGERTYYVYDATGQRVRKVTERQNGTRMKERIYLGTLELYREYNGNGTNVTLERETLHTMDDKQRIALVETRTQGNDVSPAQLIRYQFDNHLGSACLELDEQAKIISYEEYYPYGSTSYQAVHSQSETPKRYRYTGKERDEESALSFHGARYLAPWLGRWTTPDPAGIIDGPNLYVYTHDNSIRLVDPDGRQSKPPLPQLPKFGDKPQEFDIEYRGTKVHAFFFPGTSP
jgi:RHS repeat-associated protein